MSPAPASSFRFATRAQWAACLFSQADRERPAGESGLRPFAPYTRPPTLYPSPGARAPVVTRTAEVLWCDTAGTIYRLEATDDKPETFPAGFAVERTARVVATTRGLWIPGEPPDAVRLYELETLTRLLTVALPSGPIDIAANGSHGIWALVEDPEGWRMMPVEDTGTVGEGVTLRGLEEPGAFVFLPRTRRFVVLTAEPHPRLRWYSEQGEPLGSAVVAALRPCFGPTGIPCGSPDYVLASDRRERILLAGADGAEFCGGAYILVLDGDGNRLGQVPVDPDDREVTGIASAGDDLLVTGARGLLRFGSSATVPEWADEVRAVAVTPVLESPAQDDLRRWLRLEATGHLPEGATLELAVAATSDATIRSRLAAIAGNEALPASHRVAMLLGEPEIWRPPTVFHGSGSAETPATLSAPLHDVRERYLWAAVTLIGAPGARLPEISRLEVVYPGRTLMDDLPAIYRRAEAEPGSFLRALVGVLEATTQELDARIGALGRQVHPSSASGDWLDFVARWLGVPWDDALSGDQKRAILRRAPELARTRGTRAGLEGLLESLVPGTPRRFRVTDATADYGFALVGGERCDGSPLPALLAGETGWRAALGTRAVLGLTRLPCPGDRVDVARPIAGRIVVEVAATARERQAWQPWFLTVIKEMVPLTARLKLRWVGPHALRGDRLDGTLRLESEWPPVLGAGGAPGLARLPDAGGRLSASGVGIGTRLG